jgi:outer membrane receptor protein involved in Fe transport
MNRRVDRPNEVDIRIFPKYDDAEIIKVGNPALRPQYTNTAEIGYKVNGDKGYLFTSLYVKKIESTITRIARTQPGNTLIYNIFQNAGNSTIKGLEMLWSTAIGKSANLSLNLNAYQNTISAFTVTNLYPTPELFSAAKQKIWSGSFKLNGLVHLPHKTDLQISAVYLAPDVVPQGKTYERYYMDAGIRKSIRQGKGELFLNATDLFNTLRIRRATYGTGFHFVSTDYYETQVFRTGVNFKF